jgi:hypothetical protein
MGAKSTNQLAFSPCAQAEFQSSIRPDSRMFPDSEHVQLQSGDNEVDHLNYKNWSKISIKNKHNNNTKKKEEKKKEEEENLLPVQSVPGHEIALGKGQWNDGEF